MSNDEQARIVRAKLKTLVAGAGFVGRSGTFNRSAKESLVHVVELQLGRQSLVGSCTVNVGIYIPDIAAVFTETQRRDNELLNDAHCEVRCRIGELMPHQKDHWWRFIDKPEQTAGEVAEAVSRYALPFLTGLSDKASIVAAWPRLEAATPPRRNLSLALLLASIGKRQEALALLDAADRSSNSRLSPLARKVRGHMKGGSYLAATEDSGLSNRKSGLTEEMLEVYARFGGDLDGFARTASPKDKAIIGDAHWHDIASLIQNIRLVEAGYASPEMAAKVTSKVSEDCETSSVRERLWKMASEQSEDK